MAYLQTNLLQKLMGDLGRTEMFRATGGSATTVINTVIGTRPIKQRPKQDYAIDYYIFIAYDAGGAGAAPEGEYRRVSGYNATTYTYTVDTAFTVSPAVGDRCMLVDAEMFMEEVIQRVNDSIQELTIVGTPDTSNTTIANQQDYSLPVAAKRELPVMVEIQTVASDDESYREIEKERYAYIPSAGGSAGSIHLLETPVAGMKLRITHKIYHPSIPLYNSVIHENVPKEVALLVAKVAVLDWYVNANEDSEFWAQKLNIARSDLEILMSRQKSWVPPAPKKFLPPL